MIDKIESAKDYDEVWLSEMPTPVTFSKKIILWVDDQPKNNLKPIAKIQEKSDIEILQLTSTKMAE
jgi:hypothetical protein